MKEYVLFLKDKSVIALFIFIISFEIFLQAGCYKPLLKNQSYASNVNRITDHVLNKKKDLNPDVLIVGTSLAQEGVLLSTFNEKLKPIGKKVSTIAIPGSETIAQNLATEKVLPKLENSKVVLHILELERPWADETWLESVNIPMIAEFDKLTAYNLLKKYNYDFSLKDISFLLFKSIAYRKDFGDFLLNPPKRIRSIQKTNKRLSENLFVYENEHAESVEMYDLQNLDECISKTSADSKIPLPTGSSLTHKKAVHDTCHLMKTSKITNKETKTSELYFQRLKLFYDSMKKRNIKIVGVFSPNSKLGTFPNRDERYLLWKRRLNEIGSIEIFELQNVFGENNGRYYYDLLHMNREGAKIFTEELAKKIISSNLFGDSNAF